MPRHAVSVNLRQHEPHEHHVKFHVGASRRRLAGVFREVSHDAEVIEQPAQRHPRQLQRLHHQHAETRRVLAKPRPRLRRGDRRLVVGVQRGELGGAEAELADELKRAFGRPQHRPGRSAHRDVPADAARAGHGKHARHPVKAHANHVAAVRVHGSDRLTQQLRERAGHHLRPVVIVPRAVQRASHELEKTPEGHHGDGGVKVNAGLEVSGGVCCDVDDGHPRVFPPEEGQALRGAHGRVAHAQEAELGESYELQPGNKRDAQSHRGADLVARAVIFLKRNLQALHLHGVGREHREVALLERPHPVLRVSLEPRGAASRSVGEAAPRSLHERQGPLPALLLLRASFVGTRSVGVLSLRPRVAVLRRAAQHALARVVVRQLRERLEQRLDHVHEEPVLVPRENVVEIFAIRKRRQRQVQRELLLALLIELLHDALTPRVRHLQRPHHVPEVGALQQQLHHQRLILDVRVGNRGLDPPGPSSIPVVVGDGSVRVRSVARRDRSVAVAVAVAVAGAGARDVGPDRVVEHGVPAPPRVFLLGPRHPILESVHQDPVLAHVRRQDEVRDELFEPRQLRGVQVFGDANLRVFHELEHQPEVKVLEHRVRVLAKQRVLAVLEERVVEAEVTRVVAQRADVQREDLHVVKNVGESHTQAVRRREHILWGFRVEGRGGGVSSTTSSGGQSPTGENNRIRRRVAWRGDAPQRAARSDTDSPPSTAAPSARGTP